MKLRRALTTAAAAAVIAPAALMAAPAAYATGADTESSVSADPAPATPGPEQSDDTSTPTETPTAGDATQPAGNNDGTGTATGDQTGTGTGTGTGDEAGATASASPSGDTKPNGSPTSSASAKPTASAAPSDGPTDEPDCKVDDKAVKVTVVDLPSKLVAGAGWSRFSVKLANTTGKTLNEVLPVVAAAPAENIDHPKSLLDLEYQDPDTGKWTSFDEWTDGEYFLAYEMDPHTTTSLKLRIHADKSAQAGAGFALVTSDYYNEDGSCGWAPEQWYDFTVLAADSTPGTVPPAKPGAPGNHPGAQGTEKPIKHTQPEGDMKKVPVTGNLAETGSSSMLPTIALVGGVALAVGAGAVFVVRRRRTAGMDGGAPA
ncbi:LAETG motif-containing sortase-dependent surface protein [Streptomyces natalensis]|uniref:Cell wall protein n=1 Tax=Streptomyces natalensis ATCC 27448 TaxID=1240678 RepID=A0A0D7CDV5_9ACTN|nr:LAETG motif-containing sortase-dependent surface protein [Streptomyces natalensis]KIZ13562.1 cell wall protein [Streptomyces natalensis ATCC 27448]